MTRAEYEQYLLSDHWIEFSYKVKKHRTYCEKCGIAKRDAYKKYRENLHVHHLTYKNIGKETDGDVIVICKGCHQAAHGMQDWTKFVEGFAMPAVTPVGYVICANCGVPSNTPIWNMDEGYEWICGECRA